MPGSGCRCTGAIPPGTGVAGEPAPVPCRTMGIPLGISTRRGVAASGETTGRAAGASPVPRSGERASVSPMPAVG
jgi:hypothetical protein